MFSQLQVPGDWKDTGDEHLGFPSSYVSQAAVCQGTGASHIGLSEEVW